MRNTIYYAVTIIFLTIKKCFAWRYSDEIDDDYDYDKKSGSPGIFGGVIALVGIASFYVSLKNLLLIMTKSKLAIVAKTLPVVILLLLFHYDMFRACMVIWGVITIIVVLCETSEGMFLFLGFFGCGMMALSGLLMFKDKAGPMLLILGIVPHIIMYIDEKLGIRFSSLLFWEQQDN